MTEVTCPSCDGGGMADCPECGTAEAVDCDECLGTGRVDADDAEVDDDDDDNLDPAEVDRLWGEAQAE